MRVASEPDALLAVLKNPAVVVAIGSPVVVAMQSAGPLLLRRLQWSVYGNGRHGHGARYVTEFEFRYNNRAGLGVTDGERAALVMKGIEGKRLTYRPVN